MDKNPSLEHLSCYSTGIGQLKLENNTNLKNLYCQDTEIADLVLSNNLKLEELQCFNTKISALDLSANTKLKKLSCAGTYISGLDVSGNTSLTSMNTDLQYGFLNVGNNPSLQLTSVYDSAWYFTPATGSSFNIKNLFPGIDISKMTVTNGIDLESDGTVSGYSVTKPELEYKYDCGTTIKGPLTLSVRVSLTFPSSIKIKNAPNKAYDGMAAHLEADDLERTGSEEAVSYTWERWDGTDWKTISEAPVNVGKYRVTAHVGGSGILFAAADSAPVEFAIRKGVPPYTLPDDLSADIGQTLRDVSLPSGFTWVDEGQSVGAAGKNTFKAVFTPDDTVNYEIVQDIDVEVTVKRLDSTVVIHKDLNKTYDGKAVALAAGDTTVTGSSGALTYIWEKDNGSGYEPISEAPVNAGSYRVTAHVAADSSYDAADSAPVEFTIQKAAPVWTVPANLSAVYGQTLKDVSLPDGFTWADTSQSVGNVGVHTFKAVFTPDDTVNYEIVQDIDVEVSVKQSGSTVVIHKDLNKTYDGKAVALTAGDITVTGSSGALTYIWEKDNGSGYEAIPEAPVNAGSYRVTAHVAADLSYAAADSAPVEFTIKKAVPLWTAPADLSAVYGQTLRDVSLPTGFAWVDEDKSVGAVGKNIFKAVFTPDDTDNYEIVQGIDVEVSVMQYGSTVVIHKDLNKTYDGKAVALTAGDITVTGSSGALTYIWEKDNGSGYEAIPEAPVNAGSYRVTAHVAADLSYAAADSTPVEFTIQKAAPVWTAPADISAVYGQTLKDVSLPAGFTWADASQSVGNVGVQQTFKAVFTPDDTDNYEIVQNIDVKVTVKKANTNKDAPKDTAKTGDSTYPGLWAAIMLLSAGLIVLLARRRSKSKADST